jgi:predicted DNA-binding transcriptional regulator AlpA
MKLLRLADLTQKGLGKRSHLYDQIQKGFFPRPLKLHQRIACWPEQEIDRLIGFLGTEPTRESLRAFVADLVTQRKGSA